MIMWKTIQELNQIYNIRILNELEHKVAKYVTDNAGERMLDHIFQGKNRIYLPPQNNDIEMANRIVAELGKVAADIDPHRGVVLIKKKLDPKYGRGDSKFVEMAIGRAIGKLRIDDELKRNMLDWYARHRNNLRTILGKNNEYGILFTRHPIDVARMSDHRLWSSCHSPGDTHFECALAESLEGGAVAYIVKDEDMADLDLDDYENREIFKDSDRDVDGIIPKGRLRIRNYMDSKGREAAIPEFKTYGHIPIADFYETVVEFLRSRQTYKVEDFLTDGKNVNGWELVGGSYEDNGAYQLLNGYFNTHVFDRTTFRIPYDQNRQTQYEADIAEFIEETGDSAYEEFEDMIRNRFDNVECEVLGDNLDNRLYRLDIEIALENFDGVDWEALSPNIDGTYTGSNSNRPGFKIGDFFSELKDLFDSVSGEHVDVLSYIGIYKGYLTMSMRVYVYRDGDYNILPISIEIEDIIDTFDSHTVSQMAYSFLNIRELLGMIQAAANFDFMGMRQTYEGYLSEFTVPLSMFTIDTGFSIDRDVIQSYFNSLLYSFLEKNFLPKYTMEHELQKNVRQLEMEFEESYSKHPTRYQNWDKYNISNVYSHIQIPIESEKDPFGFIKCRIIWKFITSDVLATAKFLDDNYYSLQLLARLAYYMAGEPMDTYSSHPEIPRLSKALNI